MLPVLVFSRIGCVCVLCVLLPASAIKIRHWLNRIFVRVASSGRFQNWVCVVCMACDGVEKSLPNLLSLMWLDF